MILGLMLLAIIAVVIATKLVAVDMWKTATRLDIRATAVGLFVFVVAVAKLSRTTG